MDRSLRDRIFLACRLGTAGGYCRRVASAEAPQVFGPGAEDRAGLVRHFQERGWVVVDAVGPTAAAAIPGWVDEVASLADGENGVLQHFELTDTGPVLCRSENFVPVHAALRTLLCTGVFVEVAGALLEEPAILYKEKVNYKLPGGAGYSPHQDAPAYPMIDVHVSAMVAVDDADESNGGLEVVSCCFDAVLPRRARVYRAVGRRTVGLAARADAGGPHALVPQPDAASQRPQPFGSAPPRPLPHLQRGARGRPSDCVLRHQARRVRVGTARRPRAGLADRRLRRTPGMRVVFTVLDALPVRHVGADHTPVLHELARSGGFAAGGARAVMTSATYPNHATFSTGTDPRDHGVVTNWVPEPGRVVPAWKLQPRVPTVFDACRAGGRSSAAVLGDQHLVGVMGATTADRHWPPNGVPPDGTRLDAMGYVDDRDTVVEIVDALDAAPDLLISHLNGPDTAAHLFGPDSEGALAGYRDTDAQLAVMREHIAWDDTVWILVSDHDQENVSVREPVDLQAEIERRGLTLFALPEGSASLVCGDGANAARLARSDRRGRRHRGVRARGRRSRVLPGVERARARLRIRRHSDPPGHARRAAHPRTGRGGHGGPPGGRTTGASGARRTGRGCRLGPDDRRTPRARAPDRHRTRPRPLGRDLLDDRGPGVEARHRLPADLGGVVGATERDEVFPIR